jgi:hypothetical protein
MTSYWYDSLVTNINISAPPPLVFSILTDTAAYPSWNPFILSITPQPPSTRIALHTRLTNVLDSNVLKLTSPEPAPMTFTPTVTDYVQDSTFAWLGKLGIGGLFDGEHRFTLRETAAGCELRHEERFSGAVVWLGRMTGGGWYSNLIANTTAGFNAMNAALKERAERMQQTPQTTQTTASTKEAADSK